MLGSNRHQWLRLPESFKADFPAFLTLPPRNLPFDHAEQGDDIAKGVLNVDVAVRDGDEEDLQLFGDGRECQEHC